MIASDTARLLRLLTSPLLVVDPGWRIVHVNQAMCEFLGASAADMLNRPLAQLCDADSAELEQVLRLFSGCDDWQAGQLALRGGDGQTLPFPCQGAVIQRPQKGRPTLVGIEFNSWSEFGILNRKISELNDELRQQRKAGSALQASVTGFRQMFECHNAVMLLIEPVSGIIEAANAAAGRFYGYAIERLCGMASHEINTLSEVDIASKRAYAASGQCNYFIFHHRLASGDVRTVEVHASPVTIDGRCLLMSIVHDITERERAQTELRQSQQLLGAIIDNTMAVIFVKDLTGRYLLINQRYVELFKVSKEFMLGRSDHDLYPAEVADTLRAADCQVLASGVAQEFEESVPHAEGPHLYLSLKFPLLDADGQAYAVCGIATDITERKRAEDAISQNATRLKEAQRLARLGNWELDIERNWLTWSDEVFNLFEIDPAQFGACYDAFLAAIHPDDRTAVDHAYTESVRQRTPYDIVHRLLMKDGRVKYVSERGQTFYDAAGRPVRSIGTIHDITERKQAEEAIRTLNQSLEQRVKERTSDLHATEAQLREALSLNESILITSAVGVGVFRQDGQCIQVNPAFAKTVGGTEMQLLRQNFRAIPCWLASGVLDAAERALATGQRVMIETQLTSSFGQHLWLHCQLSRFFIRGEPHLLLMLHDITQEAVAKQTLQARERDFRSLAENVPDNIIRCDCDGRILYLNPTLERTLGIPASELIGKTGARVFPDDRFLALQQAMQRVGATGESVDFEQIVPGPDGSPRYHLIRIVPEPGPDGRPVSVLAVGRDVTDQKMAEEQLRLAASVFHNSSEGVLVTDAGGTILSVNPAFTETTGYEEAEALGRNPSMLRSDRHDANFYRAMWLALTTQGCWQGEVWNRRKGGEAYLEWLTINRIDDANGIPVRYVSVFHDITETQRKDERVRHLAFHDALTGLPNRTLMQDRLQHALERAKREGTRLSVTFIDLDRFKAVNDGLGHDVGDLLLQEVAQRIRTRVRVMDTVARIGGDEFVVLMEELDQAGDCACLAQELIAEISRPLTLRGHVVQVGATMGMAFFPEDGDDSQGLMKRADMAMYVAKASGRNTYRFFQQDMLDRTSQRLSMEMGLRHAISHDELVLHYQPKVTFQAAGKPPGVEALVRWQHPVRGLLAPAEFIPMAEECGLIVELGAWVLNEACRQVAQWQGCGKDIRMAVNISARQLDKVDLAEHIAALTHRHGISPSSLEIELTESTVMAHPEQVVGVLTRLREMGVTVAVDDFGTGYSSLSYLRRLPIDVLKIDRSFVMDADRNADDAQIVKTIVALGQALNLTVVAEGIETDGQAELLKSLGCDSAQGFLFSRPLPATEIEAWLDRLT